MVAIGEREIDAVLERTRRRRRKEGIMMAALRERETTLDLLGLRAVLDKGLR